jgi:predicted acylesterase/phospholipase RssA
MTGIRKTLSRVLLVATVGAGLVSCGVVPYRTARNDPLCEETRATGQAPALDSNCKLISGAGPLTRFPVSRARREFSGSDTDLPPAFVGLALSGGGSRAANFSMAVMQELQSIGVMQHVTAISSTSGGGLAGAYYALKGPDLDWPQARERMGRNFLGRWLGSQALPHHLISTSFTHEDRSDLMADIFDSNLFDEATFASLGAFGPGRPIFLANATDLATGGRFTFDDGTFHSRLSSRLDTFPIAQAVMASAAFPGAFI